MVPKKRTISFPWRDGNQFRLLIDGPAFYPGILDAIAGARSDILMEMYLVESGQVTRRFIEAFVAAARRGVTVRLLLDDFGSRELSRRDRRLLIDGNVQFALYNPLRLKKLKRNLLRTHRKFIVVDGRVAFVSGAGLADSFDGDSGWRETAVEIRGPVVADWQALFIRNWSRWSDTSMPIPRTVLTQPGDTRGRVVCTSRGRHLEVKRALLNRVGRSRERVWLATAYFVPSRKIRRALRRAAYRGVDVRLLLPGPVTDHPAVRHVSRRFYARLLRHGVRIFEYRQRFMHTKVALADDWCTIGSSNMDRWSLRWNLEANQEVDGPQFTDEVRRMLSDDFTHCNELHFEQWRHRSRLRRLQEWAWGRVDLWLAQWAPRRSWVETGLRQATKQQKQENDRS